MYVNKPYPHPLVRDILYVRKITGSLLGRKEILLEPHPQDWILVPFWSFFQYFLKLTHSATHCRGVDSYPAYMAGLFNIPLAAITPVVKNVRIITLYLYFVQMSEKTDLLINLGTGYSCYHYRPAMRAESYR